MFNHKNKDNLKSLKSLSVPPNPNSYKKSVMLVKVQPGSQEAQFGITIIFISTNMTFKRKISWRLHAKHLCRKWLMWV